MKNQQSLIHNLDKKRLFIIFAIVVLLASLLIIVAFLATININSSIFIEYKSLPESNNLSVINLEDSEIKLVGNNYIIEDGNIVKLLETYLTSHELILEKIDNSINFIIYPGTKQSILLSSSDKIISIDNNIIISGNNIYLIEDDLAILNDYENFNREIWRSLTRTYLHINSGCQNQELINYSQTTSQTCEDWILPYPNRAASYTNLEINDCQSFDLRNLSELFICEGSLAQTTEYPNLPPRIKNYWNDSWQFDNRTSKNKLGIITTLEQIKLGSNLNFRVFTEPFNNWEFETFSNTEFEKINSESYKFYPVMEEPLENFITFLIENSWDEVVSSEKIKDENSGVIQTQQNFRKNIGVYQYELSLRTLDTSEVFGDCLILDNNGIPGQTFCNDGSIKKNSGNLIEINLAKRALYSVQS